MIHLPRMDYEKPHDLTVDEAELARWSTPNLQTATRMVPAAWR
jgi:hypothetical protein